MTRTLRILSRAFDQIAAGARVLYTQNRAIAEGDDLRLERYDHNLRGYTGAVLTATVASVEGTGLVGCFVVGLADVGECDAIVAR